MMCGLTALDKKEIGLATGVIRIIIRTRGSVAEPGTLPPTALGLIKWDDLRLGKMRGRHCAKSAPAS